MPYNLLWVLIEGNDDLEFFDNVLKKLFEKTGLWDHAKPYKYAEDSPEDRASLIDSINAMKADYIVFGDINNHPGITAKKEDLIKEKFKEKITKDKIVVVIKEIESWYIAGLDFRSLRKLGIKKRTCRDLETTDHITKEDFNELIPKGKTRDIFKIEIFEEYDVDISKEKNNSFKYLTNEFIQKQYMSSKP